MFLVCQNSDHQIHARSASSLKMHSCRSASFLEMHSCSPTASQIIYHLPSLPLSTTEDFCQCRPRN